MSSANHRLRQAINIRDNAFNLMRRLSEDCNEEATSQWNQALIEMQQKALEAHWSSFQTHSIKISAVKNASILQTNQTKMVSASELYITVKQQLESLLRKCDPDRYRPKPKVSEIVLEKFNGNFTCWTAWRARFKSAVLDTQLPAGTKIDLLLSALDGEARKCAGDSEHRDDDEIDRMWAKLEQTYDNPYQIITAHINKILDLPLCERQDQQKMQDIINICDQELRSLRRFGYDVDGWSPLLAVIILRKIDRSTRSYWEMNRDPTKPPAIEDVLNYLKRRISCSINQNQNVGCSSSNEPDTIHLNQKRTNQFTNEPSNKRSRYSNESLMNQKYSTLRNNNYINLKSVCLHCKGEHKIFRCEKFSKLELSQRQAKIKEYKLCEICLKSDHGSNDCSWNGCKNCNNAKHNRIICPKFPVMRVMHVRSNKTSHKNKNSQVMKITVPDILNTHLSDKINEGNHEKIPIIGTALFKLTQEHNSTTGDIRALCDSGSQINLMTEDCVQRWKLNRKLSKLEIIGLSLDSPILSSGFIDAMIVHRLNSSTPIPIRFMVVSKISCHNPQQHFKCSLPSHLDEKELADPTFTTPGRIDALIGVGTWSSIIQEGLIKCNDKNNCFVAQKSQLGWVVSGYAGQSEKNNPLCFHINEENQNLNAQLERLWKIDDEEYVRQCTPEEQRAEDNFVSTHSRDENGRYIVTIPFRENVIPLGHSRQTAFNRLIALEKRLNKPGNEDKAKEFREFMDDYIKAKHMIPAPPPPEDPSQSFYIPYHIIYKKKTRVVFDASSKTSSGVSLNDLQLTGGKLQHDLCETILLFRTYKFALTADIIKMYRQVSVHSSHHNFQRILYRPTTNAEIGEYFITQVIWGFTSAGFNAVRALQQCASDGASKYPIAAAATMINFYMDDFLSGADDIEELYVLRQQMIELLRSGGFELSKWATSHPSLSKEISESDDVLMLQDELGVLGMGWNPKMDSFHIKVDNFNIESDIILTKRQMISRIAQVYDPTGLYTPVIVMGKIIIQEIWKLYPRLDWDQKVPDTIMNQFCEFQQNIVKLSNITVPRWLSCIKSSKIELHIFSDASIHAYGACAYIKSNINNECTTRLITSRNKVAPIKKQSIPRLELMAAVMSTQLGKFVIKACKLENVNIFYWSDSTIVIHWLNRNIASLKPFVANRTSDILRNSRIEQWNHVPGSQNPADLVSRGCTSIQLKNSSLWWNGPDWLISPSNLWPKFPGSQLSFHEIDADKEESKVSCLLTHANHNRLVPLSVYNDNKPESIESRVSTLNKLVRTTAFIFRFIEKIKQKSRSKKLKAFKDVPTITPSERDAALQYWIRQSQTQSFFNERKALMENKVLSPSSKIIQLTPYIDSKGIMRVGGRLGRSSLPLETKHQIILHHLAPISALIIKDAHNKVIHGGTQLTMNHVRQLFWITRLRPTTKKIINNCTNCVRYKKENIQQLMGSLPSCRINQAFPFSSSGVDFAGPFEIRKTVAASMTLRSTRKSKSSYTKPQTIKCWVVVFVCLATRAVHLDITHGLTVEAFMEVFARFVSRRGQCKKLWSDNGTNFVGSNKEIQRVFKEWSGKFPNKELANYGTTWNFITPSAPHQGGLWEASIKSMKHHLRRSMGRRILSANQLYTIITQIEGCLNSRPITPLNDDPSDFEALTPAHFLIGRTVTHHPISDDVVECNDNRLTLWGQQQKIYQSFWRCWKEEYLVSLQKRLKWSQTKKNLKKNDMVIIINDNLPPSFWPIGRVKEIHPGDDGMVRNVTVSTNTNDLLRPIQKLVLLPMNTTN